MVNGKILNTGDKISFGILSSLNITCAALNSNPRVDIQIFDPKTKIPLISNENPYHKCNSYVCQTQLTVILTPGYAFWNNLSQIQCTAQNKTTPFDIYSEIIVNLDRESC
jgi:hypothetical protein